MKGRLLTVLVVVLILAGLIPASAAHASDCVWYTVKRGDNLTQIARHYGVTTTAIIRANGIHNPNVIYVGQKLCIPQGGNKPPAPKCSVIHVVKKGEYVKLIATRYGVTVQSIVKANKLKNANKIRVGQRLVIVRPCPTPPKPTPKPPRPVQSAWRGQYWANRDQSGTPKFIRYVNPLVIDWGNGGPPGLGVVDNFSIRWTRTQHFPGGRYLFHIRAKDGVRLLVDGQLLINEWHEVPAPTNYAVEKSLQPGNHIVRVDYFAGHGPAQIRLQIEPLVGPIPPGPGGPWNAEYFNNTDLQGPPVRRATYSNVDFDWGKGSPMPGVSADFFSARYVGDFFFPAGDYRFYATSDDGVRVWVDDNILIDQWRVQARTTFSGDLHLSEGTHKVRVEYFEWTGVAFLKTFWTKK